MRLSTPTLLYVLAFCTFAENAAADGYLRDFSGQALNSDLTSDSGIGDHKHILATLAGLPLADSQGSSAVGAALNRNFFVRPHALLLVNTLGAAAGDDIHPSVIRLAATSPEALRAVAARSAANHAALDVLVPGDACGASCLEQEVQRLAQAAGVAYSPGTQGGLSGKLSVAVAPDGAGAPVLLDLMDEAVSFWASELAVLPVAAARAAGASGAGGTRVYSAGLVGLQAIANRFGPGSPQLHAAQQVTMHALEALQQQIASQHGNRCVVGCVFCKEGSSAVGQQFCTPMRHCCQFLNPPEPMRPTSTQPPPTSPTPQRPSESRPAMQLPTHYRACCCCVCFALQSGCLRQLHARQRRGGRQQHGPTASLEA
jgi:hypothetical protein